MKMPLSAKWFDLWKSARWRAQWERLGLPLLAVAVALALWPSYQAALLSPATGIYRDDGLYLVSGKALAEGKGYRILSTPDEMAQTKYPVLFPAMLAAIWWRWPDFPGNLVFLKTAPFVCGLFWFALAYVWLQRSTGSRWVALSFVALLAAAPPVIFLCSSLMSETLFAALTLGSLLLLRRAEVDVALWRVAVAAVLAALAYHTRSLGFCLILGATAAFLWQRHWRRAAIFGGISGGLAAPWLVWQYLQRGGADPYLSQANYYQGYNILANFTWPEKLQILLGNVTGLVAAPGALFAFPGLAILGVALLPCFVRGCWLSCWRSEALAARLTLLVSLGVILLWAWPPARFLVPLLPLCFGLIWDGVPQRARGLALGILWLLFGVCWQADGTYTAQAARSGIWIGEKVPDGAWTKFRWQVDWLAENSPGDAIVQANLHPAVYLYSGRKAVGVRQGNASLRWYLGREEAMGTAEEFRQELRQRRATYILHTPWDWFAETPMLERMLRGNLRAYPLEFPLLEAQDGYLIYGFRP